MLQRRSTTSCQERPSKRPETEMRTRPLKAERRQKIRRIRPIIRLLTSPLTQLHWKLPRRHAKKRTRRLKKQSRLSQRLEQSHSNYTQTFLLMKHASRGRRSSRHKSRKHLGRMSSVFRIPRLPPKTGPPSESVSSFTFKPCFVLTPTRRLSIILRAR